MYPVVCYLFIMPYFTYSSKLHCASQVITTFMLHKWHREAKHTDWGHLEDTGRSHKPNSYLLTLGNTNHYEIFVVGQKYFIGYQKIFEVWYFSHLISINYECLELEFKDFPKNVG